MMSLPTYKLLLQRCAFALMLALTCYSVYGQVENCYYWDGSNDIAVIPDDTAFVKFDSDWTFEVVVRLRDHADQGGYFFSKQSESNGIALGSADDGSHQEEVFFSVNGTRYWAPTAMPPIWDEQRHHVAVTYSWNTDQLEFYLDGQSYGVTTGAGEIVPYWGGDLILGYDSTADQHMNGYMEGLAIWDTLLPPATIENRSTTPILGNELGLIGYWPMKEDTGQVLLDMGPSEIHGYLGNTPQMENVLEPGRTNCGTYQESFNYCAELSFDPVPQYVRIPHHDAYNLGTANFTIEAVVKMDAAQNSFPIIYSKRDNESNSGLIFGVHDCCNKPGMPWVRMASANRTGGVAYQYNLYDNQWHHIAVSRREGNPDTTFFYVDGLYVHLERGGGADNQNLDALSDVYLGWDPLAATTTPFSGEIKEVRLWDHFRTRDQVLSTMSTPLSGDESGLLAYWPLNETEGQVVYDLSPNQNHGVLGSTTNTDPQDPVINSATCYFPSLTSSVDTVCPDSAVTLVGSGDLSYSWINMAEPESVLGNDSTITLYPSETTTFGLVGNFGDTVTVTVVVQDSDSCQPPPPPVEPIDSTLTIFQYISPDNNGYNDYLTIENIDLYPDHEIVVIDQLGRQVKRLSDYTNNWQPSMLLPGVYYCQLYIEGQLLMSESLYIEE